MLPSSLPPLVLVPSLSLSSSPFSTRERCETA